MRETNPGNMIFSNMDRIQVVTKIPTFFKISLGFLLIDLHIYTNDTLKYEQKKLGRYILFVFLFFLRSIEVISKFCFFSFFVSNVKYNVGGVEKMKTC